MGLLMPGVDQVGDTCSLSSHMIGVPDAIPDVLCTYHPRLKTVSHSSFIGVANVRFVRDRRECAMEHLGHLMVALEHGILKGGCERATFENNEIYTQEYRPSKNASTL